MLRRLQGWLIMLGWLGLLATAAATTDPRRERGEPPVVVHASHDFGPEVEFQNMAVSRLSDGRVLVANTGGMVIHDGARWRAYTHPRGLGTLWSLVPTADGRIHGGFSGDIGYFEPDGCGGYRWVSTTDQLPAAQRDFGTVWSAIGGREGVWFSAGGQTMLRRPDGRMQVFPTVRFGVFLFRIGDEVWLNDRGVGLLRAVSEGDTVRLQPIAGGEALSGMPILGVTALGENDVLIASSEGELHRWTRGTLAPFAPALWPQLAPLGVQTVTALADGSIAIGFMRSGPWVIDREGAVLERYGDDQGVPPLTTFLLHEDAVGSLWVAQNHGVVQIQRGLGSTVFDRGSGIPDASTLVRHEGHLFAGGLAGLYRLRPATDQQPAAFELVENSPRNVWELASHGGWLWVAGRGLERYRVGADGRLGTPERIVAMQFGKALQVARQHPDRLYFSGTDGAAVIDAAGSMRPQVSIVPLTGSPIQLAEAGVDEVWVGDQNNQFWRLHREGGTTWQAEAFGPGAGLPAGATKAQPGRVAPWLLAEAGAVAFDPTTRRFTTEPRWPDAAPRERLEGLLEDSEGNLWLRGEGRTGVVRPAAPDVFDEHPFRGSEDRSGVLAFLREGDVLWLARTDGVQRIELDQVKVAAAVAPTVTRLFDPRAGAALPLQAGLALTPAQRDLRIEFALPSSLRSDAALFRSRLLGSDADWSAWSSQASRDYTNLPDGALRFELEARDVYGRVSALAPLAIVVPPPWWRSPGALAAC